MIPKAPRWRWYQHLLWFLFCLAQGIFYAWLAPTHREARIGFFVSLVLLAGVFLLGLWRRRRHPGSGGNA